MGDLSGLFSSATPRTRLERVAKPTHCSALVKLLPNNTDVFISQASDGPCVVGTHGTSDLPLVDCVESL